MLTLRGAEDENAGQNNEVIFFWEDSEELCVTNQLQAFWIPATQLIGSLIQFELFVLQIFDISALK